MLIQENKWFTITSVANILDFLIEAILSAFCMERYLINSWKNFQTGNIVISKPAGYKTTNKYSYPTCYLDLQPCE